MCYIARNFTPGKAINHKLPSENKGNERSAHASSDRLRTSNLFSKVFVSPSGVMLNLEVRCFDGSSVGGGARKSLNRLQERLT